VSGPRLSRRLFLIGGGAAALAAPPALIVLGGAGVNTAQLTAGFAAAGGGQAEAVVGDLQCTVFDSTAPAATKGGSSVPGLNQVQARNARIIVAAARALPIPADTQVRAATVALVTAFQESGIRRLASARYPESLSYPYDRWSAKADAAPGDHDSVGPFQQRAAWGPMRDRMDTAASANRFFNGGDAGQRGLLDIAGWEAMTPGRAAQRVQVSAYPDAYEQWTPKAAVAVAAILGDPSALPALGQACTPTTVPVSSTSGWVMPLPKGKYRVGSAYGWRMHPIQHRMKFHAGEDYPAPTGTPVFAALGGRVVGVRISGSMTSGYGRLITLDHGSGITTQYAHLSRWDVQVGQTVTAGQQIGLVGTTGGSTGPHLHFEVRQNETPTSPTDWLKQHGVTP
jgi:murein DD-endopeptidase MepM/ murein hydrolase activator NlpD